MKITIPLIFISLLSLQAIASDIESNADEAEFSSDIVYSELGDTSKGECRFSVNKLETLQTLDRTVTLDPQSRTKVCKRTYDGLVYMITTPTVEITNTKRSNNRQVRYSVGRDEGDCANNLRRGIYLSELLTLQKAEVKTRSVSASRGNLNNKKRVFDVVCLTIL